MPPIESLLYHQHFSNLFDFLTSLFKWQKKTYSMAQTPSMRRRKQMNAPMRPCRHRNGRLTSKGNLMTIYDLSSLLPFLIYVHTWHCRVLINCNRSPRRGQYRIQACLSVPGYPNRHRYTFDGRQFKRVFIRIRTVSQLLTRDPAISVNDLRWLVFYSWVTTLGNKWSSTYR